MSFRCILPGQQVSKNGSCPKATIKGTQTVPQPSTVKGLQEFLGTINFYHRFFFFLPNIGATPVLFTGPKVIQGSKRTSVVTRDETGFP